MFAVEGPEGFGAEVQQPAVATGRPVEATTRTTTAIGLRTIRIGLLGLGQVGQAVARLASDRTAAERAGIRFKVEQALVRDVSRPRRCPRPSRLTTNPSAFLRGHYDVVIEALDAVEPARTLVARLLGRGTAVVTANKALVAAHGAQLGALAAARGAAFRYEASALSAVPFLGTLAERPLVSSVDRALAIVNGTSNFILSTLAEGKRFDEALALAQQAGYAEPDPSRDLDGVDAANKLALLAGLFGWGEVAPDRLEVRGVRGLTADDLAAARALGGSIKPVAWAARSLAAAAGGPDRVVAYVGPALLPASEPLAALGGALNGIRLDGRYVSNLFFSGPGAGPDVTGATLLDDAAQAVSSVRLPRGTKAPAPRAVAVESPVTPWLIRLTFPGIVPAADAASALASSVGLRLARASAHATADSRWLVTDSQPHGEIDTALARLSSVHRVSASAVRVINPEPSC